MCQLAEFHVFPHESLIIYIYIYILISIYESYDVAFLACEHQNFEEVAKEDV